MKTVPRRINENLVPQEWISLYEFGFSQAHPTIQQSHRITQTVNKAPGNKKYCSTGFLEISQAFDKVWYLDKIKKIFALKIALK